MSKLATQLLSVPQQEDAGADAASRFHYQALYGLALIFEAHKTGKDYAVVFEYHDDIAFLDSSVDPTKVSYFQVKTKRKGHWNLGDIVRQAPSAKNSTPAIKLPSFIGKMYRNVLSFGDFLESTTFVSNAQMNFGAKSESFTLAECSEDEIKKVVAQIKSEHPATTFIKSDIVRFVKSDLSLDDLDTHAKGKLNKFVVDHLGQVEFSIDALYRAVIDECTRKSRIKGSDASIEQVIARRAVTKTDADAWLSQVRKRMECPSWEVISPEIACSVLSRATMMKDWKRYCTEVLDANAAVSVVRGEVARHLNNGECDHMEKLQEVIDHILPKVEAFAQARLNPITTEKIKVMIIYETYTRSET